MAGTTLSTTTQPGLHQREKGSGPWVVVTAGLQSGLVSAIDLGTSETLAWLPLSAYGDRVCSPHQLAALPSPNPQIRFDFFFTCEESSNVYKATYNGLKLDITANITDIIGIGLSSHVTISPDARLVAVADIHKDILWVGDTSALETVAAFRFDWEPQSKNLIVERIASKTKTEGFQLEKNRGAKQEGTNETVADGMVWDPRGRLGAVSLRARGLIVVMDTIKWEPTAVLRTPKGSGEAAELVAREVDRWRWRIGEVLSYSHQLGFSPDGRFLAAVNNIRQQNLAVFDASDQAAPEKWRKRWFVDAPENMFFSNMGYTPDSKKLYLVTWAPPPRGVSRLAVVETSQWQIEKYVDIGFDAHTVQVTPDGRWAVGVYSGWQGSRSGLYVVDTSTDDIVTRLPSPMGHHDHVIVPRKPEDLRVGRSTTL